MSEYAPEAFDAGEIDYSQWDADFDDVHSVEVDGEHIELPTREQERAQMAAELHAHQLDQAREELAAEYPDMKPELLAMLQAEDPQQLRELGAEVARRLGVRSNVAHPGDGPSREQQIPGENALQKALNHAKAGGSWQPYLSLKESAALAGRPLTEAQADRVRSALAWARRVGDAEAVTVLSRQLGGR